jgi:tetratricopeptide (TPR) repeat protein
LEPVLRQAASSNPHDAAARYHLGCLLYGQGRREEAIEEWEAAALGAPEFAVGRRNLALAYRQVRDDLHGAERELRAAVAASPGDIRLYLELNDVLKARGGAAAERLAALDAAPEEVQRRGAIAAQQIMCCIQLEEWDRAISLLRTHTFHRWEMEFRMRRVYLEACLGRGTAQFDGGDFQGAREDFELALEYPMNIRIGRPAHPRDARAHWCAAAACDALGDLAAAKKHWESAAAETYHHPGSDLALYRALSLKKLGRRDESDAALREALDLAQKCADMAPDDATAQFSLALTLIAVERKGEAEAPLARALELDPESRRAKRLAEGKPIL